MASKKQGASSRGNATKATTKKAAKKAAPRKRRKTPAPTRTQVIEDDGSAELAAELEARSPGISTFIGGPPASSKRTPGRMRAKYPPDGES